MLQHLKTPFVYFCAILLFTVPIAFGGAQKRGCLSNIESKLDKLLNPQKTPAKDMIQQFKGKPASEVRHDYRGGEGKIYIHQNNPHLALKVFVSPTGNTKESIDNFIDLTKAVNGSSLNRATKGKLIAPQVYESGPNWITRSFYPNTIPLNEVKRIQDIKMSKKCGALMSSVAQALTTVSNSTSRLLIERIHEKSVNIHCDPEHDRLVVIDSLLN